MCGIVGYVGPKQCVNLIVDGLRKLEYRGYDSAGIAVVDKGGLTVKRAKGKLANLVSLLAESPLPGTTGIGHTRWATHGRPSDENAHPHAYQGVAVVHNGIIENHLELKASLSARGHKFRSETDTEIFAHLISEALEDGKRDLCEAVRASLTQVRGTYAIAVVSQRWPDEIVAAKNASPLVVGFGDGENFLASDVPAILEHTREVIYLEEGELARLTPGGVTLFGRNGEPLSRKPRRIEWSAVAAEKDGHRHFMHKEIVEQPRAVADTIRGRTSLEQGDVTLEGFELSPEYVQSLERVVIVACGTSSHAGLAGRSMIEELARIPAALELASEFRNRDPLVNERVMCIAITQSGETADTLAAVKVARARGARAFAVCNVVGSAISRECRRRHPLHPRRTGDQRRLHQGLHHPARRPLPARRPAGPAARNPLRRRGANTSRPFARSPSGWSRWSARKRPSCPSPRNAPPPAMRSSSAAATNSRSPWRAR